MLKRFRSKDDFLLHLVTVDETWVHFYEPENKAQSRQWVGRLGPRSLRPKKKFKTKPSDGKVTSTVFWDAKGVISAIREKHPGKLSKGVLLQQDNVRVNTCKVVMDAVER